MDEKLEQLAQRLLERIEESEDEERYRSYRDQLYGIGPEVAELMRAQLTHPHFRRRMAAATNLGRLGDVGAAPLLVRLLGDPQAGVREMALFALGILGDTSVTGAILNSLNDYDADVRYRALVALSDLGYADLEDVLIRCMSDEAYGVREQALGQLRSVASVKAMPVVLRALLEREVEMQQMAEEALDRLIPKMTREHYKQLREQLKPRECRLILNYLEARNLQEVYNTLWKRLQITPKPSTPRRDLDKYGRILTDSSEPPLLGANSDSLGNAYERNAEVDQLINHFATDGPRRSILLVGEAGVGKTAIIHELARHFRDTNSNWLVLETNTSELISGTRYLGDWETKLKEMAQAIIKDDKRVLLYITNPNDLLGAGAHSKSDENFADFFKPYLQRGQLHIIAECTEESLKGGLNRDPGFLRLFRQIKIQPMDDAKTLRVLEQCTQRDAGRASPGGLRAPAFADGTLELIVDLARSFYTRAQAPGRACDLYDAVVDYVVGLNPLDEKQRKREIEDAKKAALRPEDSGLTRLEAPLPIVHITSEHVIACLSELTGMSLDLLDDRVPLDLAETEAWFKSRLIDQDHAVDALVDRLAIIKAGLGNPERPLGVYFLVGPTGVGKTYFAKLVAQRLFGSPERMVRFDLSEYRGRFALEKLIGSPHEKSREGLLTEAIKNQPFTVLLFDEFEKADSEVYNLFLQILDEGRLTDAQGRTTDFRQALIFLTSNLGASRTSIASVGFDAPHASASSARPDATARAQQRFAGRIQTKLDEFFAPEFLNRLDEVVVFNPLTPHAMHRLVALELKAALQRRGLARRNLHVETSPEAMAWFEAHGFSERFGARELKRVIERHLLAPLSRLIVADPTAHSDRTLLVDVNDDELSISFADYDVTHTPVIPRKPRAPSRVD